MFFIEAKRIIVVIFGSLLLAISLNFFLINANVYASGFAGAAQLASSVLKDFSGISISTGILLLLFNIPVIILGWYKVGRGFTIYSIVSVIFVTIFLELLPVISVSEDIILNAVVGGVIAGVGVGISLKLGASTGGMDIIAMFLSRLQDKPIGTYFLLLNGVIIVMAGILYKPENALYTMLALYVTTAVIDTHPHASRKSNRNDCYTKSGRIAACHSPKNGAWNNDFTRKRCLFERRPNI